MEILRAKKEKASSKKHKMKLPPGTNSLWGRRVFLCCHCVSCRSCVECFLKAKDQSDECAAKCSSLHATVSNSTDFDKSRAALCTLKNEDSCLLTFSLVDTDHGSIIYNPELYDCPEPLNAPLIALGVCMSVLIFGITLLVIWKFLVSVHDRKEVAKFEAEKAKAKWQTGTNPLFRSSTSTFKNVTYKSKQQKSSLGY